MSCGVIIASLDLEADLREHKGAYSLQLRVA